MAQSFLPHLLILETVVSIHKLDCHLSVAETYCCNSSQKEFLLVQMLFPLLYLNKIHHVTKIMSYNGITMTRKKWIYQTQASSTGAVLQSHHMLKISLQANALRFQSLWLSEMCCLSSVHQMWQQISFRTIHPKSLLMLKLHYSPSRSKIQTSINRLRVLYETS